MSSLLLAITIGLASTQGSPSLDKDLDVALGTAGLTSATARFSPEILKLFRQGEFSTPLFESCLANPWQMPFLSAMTRRQISVNSGTPSEALSSITRLAGVGTRRTLLGDPVASAQADAVKPGALTKVLESMKSKGWIVGSVPSLQRVPAATQQAAALVLRMAIDSVPKRRAAFENVASIDSMYKGALVASSDSDEPEVVVGRLKLYRSLELSFLVAAAHDLTVATIRANQMLSTIAPNEAYQWKVDTIWGSIELTGGSDSTHKTEPRLLLIDTGGSDTYLNVPANQSPTNWCSVAIDPNGDDKYLSDVALATTTVAKWSARGAGRTQIGPGCAVAGVTLLVDSRGNDLYRSHRPGIGSATYGVAVVYDREGDDTYDAYADGIGYAKFGAAVLEDGGGADSYAGFTQVQGVGLTGGTAMLLDVGGDDKYVANDEVIDFASPQTAEHNVSMAQGAGYGRRADYLDGHSMSGGIGILYDVAGKDSYLCGVFGQGVGYWEGVGMLWDDQGNDTYKGQWYVQGASAHFAIGYLEDGAGTDTYVAPMNMAQGAGHDFGFGMLVEQGGNDTYRAPNLSLGAGNANGMGMLFEVAGDDRYECLGLTLGRAAEASKGSMRERAICFGLFMDLAGNDTYPASATWAKNGARTANWTERLQKSEESQVGIFWDR